VRREPGVEESSQVIDVTLVIRCQRNPLVHRVGRLEPQGDLIDRGEDLILRFRRRWPRLVLVAVWLRVFEGYKIV
jgi:hypothetical protein